MKQFLILSLLLLTSCQSMVRLGAAMSGAAAGALGGPSTAAVGAGVGVAAADLYLQEDEIEEQEEQIKALTIGDVTGALDVAQEGILDQVYSLIKLVVLAIIVFVSLSLLYTWKRKKAAMTFYDDLLKIKDKLEL